jgi:hypothetical protein
MIGWSFVRRYIPGEFPKVLWEFMADFSRLVCQRNIRKSSDSFFQPCGSSFESGACLCWCAPKSHQQASLSIPTFRQNNTSKEFVTKNTLAQVLLNTVLFLSIEQLSECSLIPSRVYERSHLGRHFWLSVKETNFWPTTPLFRRLELLQNDEILRNTKSEEETATSQPDFSKYVWPTSAIMAQILDNTKPTKRYRTYL